MQNSLDLIDRAINKFLTHDLENPDLWASLLKNKTQGLIHNANNYEKMQQLANWLNDILMKGYLDDLSRDLLSEVLQDMGAAQILLADFALLQQSN